MNYLDKQASLDNAMINMRFVLECKKRGIEDDVIKAVMGRKANA